jgi:Flp pilus assembly pilin Flp
MKTTAHSRIDRVRQRDSKSRRPRREPLLGDDRGVYYTEYTIVLVLVAIALGTALVFLGGPLLRFHDSVVLPVQVPTF